MGERKSSLSSKLSVDTQIKVRRTQGSAQPSSRNLRKVISSMSRSRSPVRSPSPVRRRRREQNRRRRARASREWSDKEDDPSSEESRARSVSYGNIGEMKSLPLTVGGEERSAGPSETDMGELDQF